jgi:hypothetical protein
MTPVERSCEDWSGGEAEAVSSALHRVRDELLAEGGMLAAAVVTGEPAADPPVAALAASGPRVADRAEEIAFAVAAVHEGYLLHYGQGTLLDLAGDPDLALLAGDRLYAMGLDRLAAAGDLVAVVALADVIAGCAEAHASGDETRAAAIWDAGATAIGWGRQGHTDGRLRDRV